MRIQGVVSVIGFVLLMCVAGLAQTPILDAEPALAQEESASFPIPAVNHSCPSGYSHNGDWCEPSGASLEPSENQPAKHDEPRQRAQALPDINHSCPDGYGHQGGPQGSQGWCIPMR